MSADLIETAAAALGPVSADVVFLGGATIYLWISDRAAPETRATNDVDVISAVVGKAGYYKLGEQLRKRGFSEASDSNVICRWNHAETGLVLSNPAGIRLKLDEQRTERRGTTVICGVAYCPAYPPAIVSMFDNVRRDRHVLYRAVIAIK